MSRFPLFKEIEVMGSLGRPTLAAFYVALNFLYER